MNTNLACQYNQEWYSGDDASLGITCPVGLLPRFDGVFLKPFEARDQHCELSLEQIHQQPNAVNGEFLLGDSEFTEEVLKDEFFLRARRGLVTSVIEVVLDADLIQLFF